VTVRVGVVGSGFMGRTWANVAIRSERTTLAGVAGGRRAARLAGDLDCRLFDDVGALLTAPEVDVVVLASPPAVHAEQTLAAARAGKSVLVEKPMAQNAEECRAMTAACAEAGVALSVVSQHRFRAAPRAARAIVDAGTIGAVTMIRAIGPETGWWDVTKTQDAWKLDPAQQTAYASWGAHACDLVRWFVGSEADLVFALFAQYGSEPPAGRSAMATYRFRNGAMAQLWMSYDIPRPGLGSGLQLQIVGEDGMIELDSYGEVRLGRGEEWTVPFSQDPFDAFDPLDAMRLDAYTLQLDDLVEAATTGGRPIVDGEEGIATTAMLEAAERSAASGEAVRIGEAL
jgi:predicted dehydrogenase